MSIELKLTNLPQSLCGLQYIKKDGVVCGTRTDHQWLADLNSDGLVTLRHFYLGYINEVYSAQSPERALAVLAAPFGLNQPTRAAHRPETEMPNTAPKQTPAEWLKTLPAWDGIPRVATWLTYYLGVEPDDDQQFGTLFFIGLVARAIEPGSWFPICLVLEGEQSIGKSRAAKILGGDWYGNADFDVSSRDACSALQDKWLYEFAEMRTITRAEKSLQKSFLSRQFDEFRPIYGRREIRLARQVVFIGTTNEAELVKPSRRFWPVHCTAINLEALAADREQLFAEALAQYRADPQILSRLRVAYTPATEPSKDSACSGVAICPNCRQAINQQGAKDSLVDLLDDWVKTQTNPFSINDAANTLGLNEQAITRDLKTRIGTALRRLGCKPTGLKSYYSFTQGSQPHAEPRFGPFEERSSSSIAPSDQPPHQHPSHQSDAVDHQPDGVHPVDLPSPKPTTGSPR